MRKQLLMGLLSLATFTFVACSGDDETESQGDRYVAGSLVSGDGQDDMLKSVRLRYLAENATSYIPLIRYNYEADGTLSVFETENDASCVKFNNGEVAVVNGKEFSYDVELNNMGYISTLIVKRNNSDHPDIREYGELKCSYSNAGYLTKYECDWAVYDMAKAKEGEQGNLVSRNTTTQNLIYNGLGRLEYVESLVDVTPENMVNYTCRMRVQCFYEDHLGKGENSPKEIVKNKYCQFTPSLVRLFDNCRINSLLSVSDIFYTGLFGKASSAIPSFVVRYDFDSRFGDYENTREIVPTCTLNENGCIDVADGMKYVYFSLADK